INIRRARPCYSIRCLILAEGFIFKESIVLIVSYFISAYPKRGHRHLLSGPIVSLPALFTRGTSHLKITTFYRDHLKFYSRTGYWLVVRSKRTGWRNLGS